MNLKVSLYPLVTFLIFSFFPSVFSQTQGKYFIDTLMGKWGCKDALGKTIVPFQYDEVRSIKHDSFFIAVNNLVKEMPYNRKGPYELLGLYYFTGQIICKPIYYKLDFALNKDVIILTSWKRGRKYNLAIDYSGKVITKARRSEIINLQKGEFAFIVSAGKNYILRNDSLIPTHLNFDSIRIDRTYYWWNSKIVETNNKTYDLRLIQPAGNGIYKVLSLSEAKIKRIRENDCAILTVGKQSGILDRYGYIIDRNLYDEMSAFYSGYSKVSINRKCGLLDQSGHLCTHLTYNDIKLWHFGGGMSSGPSNDYFAGLYATVKTDSGWQLINRSGQEICSTFYDSICKYENNHLAKVMKNGKWGIIDKAGREIMPVIYDMLEFVVQCEHSLRPSDGTPIISNRRFKCLCPTGSVKRYCIINRDGKDAENETECEEDEKNNDDE